MAGDQHCNLGGTPAGEFAAAHRQHVAAQLRRMDSIAAAKAGIAATLKVPKVEAAE